MANNKTWEERIAHAKAVNAQKQSAGVKNAPAVKTVSASSGQTKSWEDRIAHAKKVNADKQRAEYEAYIKTDEYKWASENEKRRKSGLGYNVNNGQIYSFEPVTKDSLQKSIEWADSEIKRLKEQGASTDWFTAIGNFGLRLGGMEGVDRTELNQQLSDLQSQRAVYQKYLENAEYEEAMSEIEKNGDGERFSELFAIDSRKNNLFDALSNIGGGGNAMPSRNADDIEREAQLKSELQAKYGENFKKYRELYAKGSNDEFSASLVKKMEETIDEHPVLGTIGYTLGNIVTAPVRGIGVLSDSLNKGMGNYGASSGSLFQDMSEATVQKVNESINNTFKNDYAAGFVRTVYNAAVSGAESMMSMGTFGKLGEAVLGLNAATSTYKDGKARGLSDGQALANGVAAGIFEALFEHLSLEKLRAFQASPSTTLKPFIKNVLKQSVAEGSEEVFTDIANEAYDYFVNGGLSQYEEALRSGVTPEEYGRQFIAQLGETFITGALAGGGMIGMSAAPGATLGSVSQVMTDKKQGSKIRSEGEIERTISAAKEQGGNLGKKAGKIEKQIAEGESVSDRRIGQLDRKTTKAERERAVDTILSSADYEEVSGKEKRAIRSSVLTLLSSGEVSYEQAEVLETENGKKVLEAAQKWEVDKILEIGAERAERRSTNIKKALDEGSTESLVKNTFSAVNAEGHKVSVGAVRSITDGEFEIVQDRETGATAKLSELKIEDKDARGLYAALQTAATGSSAMSVDAVNIALSLYNPYENKEPSAYVAWAHDAYKAGSLKRDNTVLLFNEFTAMFNDSYSGDITRQQLYSMYEAGARQLETEPGVTIIGAAGMTPKQAEQIFIIGEVAKKSGLQVVVVNGQLTDDDGRNINGLYKAGTNRIVLSLASENDLVLSHAGHELYHWAKEQSPEWGQFLQDNVINILKSDSKYDFEGIYRQAEADYTGSTEAEILEEITAQYLAVAFSDESNIKRIVSEASPAERSFLERLVARLKEFIKDIRARLELYASSDKTVKAAVETPTEQLDDIADMFMQALTEAGKTKKPAVSDGGVKLSLSMSDNDSIKQQLRTNIKQISEMDTVASIEFDDISKKELREKAVDEFKKFGYVIERQNFGKITIGPDEIRDGTNYINTSGEKAALLCVPKVLKRGIVIGEHQQHKNRLHDTITIAAPVEINGDNVCVAVAVKRTSKNKYHAHRVLTFTGENFVIKEEKNNTKPTTPGMTAKNNGEGPSIGSVSDNSITQSISGVNKYSLSLDETGGEIEQMKLENESFFQYIERLGDKIGNQIKAKRAPDSELIYDRAAFYEIAKKYNLFDADAENSFNKNKYSDTELVNSMEHIMVGISDGIISPTAGLERLARIQQDILRSGYELRYGKDKNGNAISEDAANAFKKDIRNKPIYVSKYTYSLLMEQYKTRRNLRNASFNQLSIREEDTENAPNIELLYGELLKKHPALLDDVTEQLDMINELISTERAVHPQVEYISEKEGFKGFIDLSEAGVRRAADMLTEAFNVELVQGNLQQQYKELRNARQSLDRTKRYYRNLLEDSARIRSEREEKVACIKRIVRTTRRLDKLLRKETDTKHIPEGLKEPVAKFLQIIQGSLKNSFDESLIDDSLSIAELNKAYVSYSTENTANTDEEYSEKMSQLQFVLHGDKRLRELSIGELKTVEDVVAHFNFIVNEGNQMFVDELKRGYEHTASVSVENLYPHIENRKKGLERIKDAEFKMLTPYMFFKHIGTHFEGSQEVTEILGELGNALFKGEEKTARNVEKVKNITQEIMQTWGYDSRWASDERDIVLESGQKVSMSSEKIMHTLAMYEREASKGFKTDHILAGGIVVNSSTPETVTGIIKPIPEAIKTRRAFNKAQKERKARLKNNGGKIFVGMNDADRAKLLTETALEVVDATDVELSDDVNNQLYELKNKNKTKYLSMIRDFGKEIEVFKDYTNENVSIEFNYSIGSARESVDKVFERHADRSDFVKMFSVFDEIIKNAQLIEAHNDKYKGTKKENTNLKQVYVLLSAFQDGNSIIPVEFEIKEFKTGVKNQLYVSVNLKRIETEVMKAVGHKSPDAFRPVSTYKLSDIISNVNPLDSEFLKYIPASMLDRQQVEGRNEGIRKEKLRIAEIEKTGDVSVRSDVTEDEQRALAEKIAETMRVYISKNDIKMLRRQLNGQQTGYYKALVKAMSEDGAALGNETSLKLFGTKKYTEEQYCPASVVSDYLLERFGVKEVGEKRLKNRSFTKRITENANAPILIDNISEIYAKHMYEMCIYNGMTIPLESIERLLNYKLPDEYERVGDKIQIKKGKSYRELFREAFGDRGLQYLENLMRDLNGGIRVDNRGALNSMMTNFKRSAVSASLTVAMQQPGSVARAMFRIAPQYFTPTIYVPAAAKVLGKYTDKAEVLDRYGELLKYCPLAVIKDVGKFDTNVGQSFEDWILDAKPRFRKDIKEINRVIPWLYHELEDVMMWIPGYLDRATWVHIWNAVKRETAAKNGVRVSKLTEKMLTEAGERMSQVIRETQVYDSVLSRSDLMRSKNALTQMATSFMAEPTVTYNMMMYAATTAKYQPKVLVRAIASVLCSIILADFLKNLAKAIRYDDEESNFGEMLISGTVVDIISDFNPLTYIPYVKDIWSMFEGYDIERVDMSVFSKVVDAINPFLDSEEEITYAHWEQLGITLSMFTGIPVNNLMKDITGIKARFKKGSPEFSGTAVGNTIRTELSENPFIKATGKLIPPIYNFFNMSDERVIYNAILNEDEATLDRYRGYSEDDVENYIDKGYSFLDASLKASDNAESNFHSKVINGLVSEDIRIKEAAEARLEADTPSYELLVSELTELGFDKNDVIKAIEKYIASMEDKVYEKSESKDKALYTNSDLVRVAEKYDIFKSRKIIESFKHSGKEDGDIRTSLTEIFKSKFIDAWTTGNYTEVEKIRNFLNPLDVGYKDSTFSKWEKEANNKE